MMNNEKIDNEPTLEQFKKIVQSKFDEYKKQGYKLGQAYNIESKKYGFANWHHMCATLKNKAKKEKEDE
jgi:hypothetical protein